MRALIVATLTASVALLCVGCPASSPPADGGAAATAPKAEAPGAKAPAAAKALPAPKPLPAPKALPAAQGGGDAGASGSAGKGDANTAPPGPEILGGPKLSNMTYRLIVEASFSDLPAGAYIVAPAARDRRYQKVMKSEHSGVVGAVTATDDGENLFFVSEPTKAGAASYVGTFEVSRRVGTEGGIDRAKGKAFQAGKGKVKANADDKAMAAIATALGADTMKPFDALVAAANKSASGEGAGAYKVADTAATLMRLKGVPATVIGGYRAPKGGVADKTHSWVLAELPDVGLTPLDPALRVGQPAWKEGTDPANMGQIDAERVEMVSGDALVIPALDGVNPRFELQGDLVAPQAIKDGKVVGKVTWKARFEALPTPKK
ncbi:MAG: hypothetical protein ACPGU1_05670 [Myxococcota bacterium]